MFQHTTPPIPARLQHRTPERPHFTSLDQSQNRAPQSRHCPSSQSCPLKAEIFHNRDLLLLPSVQPWLCRCKPKLSAWSWFRRDGRRYGAVTGAGWACSVGLTVDPTCRKHSKNKKMALSFSCKSSFLFKCLAFSLYGISSSKSLACHDVVV